MKIFGYEIGKKADPTANASVGDVSINEDPRGIMKAYIPEFLYKPPFGYPRKENLPLIRQLARNPYIFSVIKTLCDEAASTDYDVVFKEDVEQTPKLEEIRKSILNFFDNPNRNKESFSHLLRASVKDICELDSGIWVKVYNEAGELVSMFARDGASFLMNPDIYGYLGNRSDYIEPMNIDYAATPESADWTAKLHTYSLAYKEQAAYFQYGTTAMALPVPFGRKEVIYMMQNPRSDNIYGLSPIQILADVITTLVYGASYNLDFYMNNNMPEGILEMIGADKATITAVRERLDKQIRAKDENTGFWRKIGYKVPITNVPAKFTPFQLDPKVMQVVEQQQWFTKLVWACFGVTPDEMGFTEDSNKAVSQSQHTIYKRKAVRPILALIKYHIDKEIIPEWGEEAFKSLEFQWNDYDLDEDIKKHSLYQSQLNLGIKTSEMIAEEEGIDLAELKRQKDEQEQKEMDKENDNSFSLFDKFEGKSIKTKAMKIRDGSTVKIVGNHKQFSGQTGTVEWSKTNGKEIYYMVRFRDGMDIFFLEELKLVDGDIYKTSAKKPKIDKTPLGRAEAAPENVNKSKSLKAQKFENDLEKELVTAIKARSKQLLKAIDQLKTGELDKVKSMRKATPLDYVSGTKAKYVKREGSSGNYRYYYDEPKKQGSTSSKLPDKYEKIKKSDSELSKMSANQLSNHFEKLSNKLESDMSISDSEEEAILSYMDKIDKYYGRAEKKESKSNK